MFKLPNVVLDFFSAFHKNNYQIYLVGGAVRDLLLNKKPEEMGDNWDFATNATPEEILKLFPKGIYENKYGTVLILINDQQSTINNSIIFEITPFRKESDYVDYRHPEKIEWAKTIVEDLARRDFTINSIAFDGKKLSSLWGILTKDFPKMLFV